MFTLCIKGFLLGLETRESTPTPDWQPCTPYSLGSTTGTVLTVQIALHSVLVREYNRPVLTALTAVHTVFVNEHNSYGFNCTDRYTLCTSVGTQQTRSLLYRKLCTPTGTVWTVQNLLTTAHPGGVVWTPDECRTIEHYKTTQVRWAVQYASIYHTRTRHRTIGMYACILYYFIIKKCTILDKNFLYLGSPRYWRRSIRTGTTTRCTRQVTVSFL